MNKKALKLETLDMGWFFFILSPSIYSKLEHNAIAYVATITSRFDARLLSNISASIVSNIRRKMKNNDETSRTEKNIR
jgi:hypothetical protein